MTAPGFYTITIRSDRAAPLRARMSRMVRLMIEQRQRNVTQAEALDHLLTIAEQYYGLQPLGEPNNET